MLMKIFIYMYVYIQLNCVVMKGLNDDEICDFVQLTEQKVQLCSIFSNNVITNTYSLHGYIRRWMYAS